LEVSRLYTITATYSNHKVVIVKGGKGILGELATNLGNGKF